MNHVHGAVEVGACTVFANNECSGTLIFVTIVALVVAAIVFGLAYSSRERL